MPEVTLVLGALVLAGLVGLAGAIFTPFLVVMAGVAILALGLLVGVPTGFWYHALLYRLVSAKQPLPRRWWLSPTDLHPRLTDAERRRLTPWFRIGGVGFVLCVLGGLTAIAGVFLDR